MTKVEKIRIALGALDAGDDLDSAEVTEVSGIKNAVVHLASMVKSGEVIASGESGSMRYRLNPDYKPARQRRAAEQLPIKRPKKHAKPAKRHATGKRRAARTTFRKIARKLTEQPAQPAIATLLLDNAIAAGTHLVSTVQAQVEGIDDNPVLAAAIDQAQRALQLLAVRP